MKNIKGAFILGFSLVGLGAIAALRANRLKIDTTCKDERLYMDGSFYATVESSHGLNKRTVLTVFQRHNGKRILLDSWDAAIKGSQVVAPNVRLEITNQRKGDDVLARIRGTVKGQRVKARLLCMQKS